MKNRPLKIGVFGLWHLGCVYATSLAKLGFEVEGSDFDKKIVKNLNNGQPPIFEPEMESTIKTHLNKNLRFVELENLFKDKDYIFLTFDLPVDNQDRVNTKLIDMAMRIVKKYVDKKTVLVVSSQIPCGTCRKISKVSDNVIYFPENVRLGKAYETFLKPDRIILGSDRVDLMDIFESDFKLFNCPFIKMGWESAEMVKHALNSYLATCVSFSSEMSDLCELLGANMGEVVAALKSDRRVSPFAPINPGMGFAGATLGRDIKSLKYLGLAKEYKTKLFNAVYQVNSDRVDWLITKMEAKLGKLNGKQIGVLGLTYKPGTNTLRRSMSLELISKLKTLGVKISAYDPVIKNNIPKFDFVKLCVNSKELFLGQDAVVLMTEWPEFKEIDFKNNSKDMQQKIVFDTKNFLDREKFENTEILYVGTGV